MKPLFIIAALLVSAVCLLILIPAAFNGLADWRAGCDAEARQMSYMDPGHDPNSRWWCPAAK